MAEQQLGGWNRVQKIGGTAGRTEILKQRLLMKDESN